MLTDFYIAFGPVCFTLLGLWLVVIQTRHEDWRGVTAERRRNQRRAYGVAMHFSLPGLMSVLSLIDPASTTLWRVSFAIVAGGGALVLVLVRGSLPGRMGQAAYVIAVAMYALIAVIAVVPTLVTDVGLSVRALRVEAVLLAVLVFLGVNVAWLLLFEEAPPARDPPTGDSAAGRGRRHAA